MAKVLGFVGLIGGAALGAQTHGGIGFCVGGFVGGCISYGIGKEAESALAKALVVVGGVLGLLMNAVIRSAILRLIVAGS